MCKHYITKLKRECKLNGKYDGYCGKHKKGGVVTKSTKTRATKARSTNAKTTNPNQPC